MKILHALKYGSGLTTAPSKPKKTKKPPEEDFSVSEDGKAVSEAEYWEHYYEHSDFNYEWDNGVLEEVHAVSDFEGYTMFEWFLVIVRQYLEVNPVGKTVGLEFGFRMALPNKTAIRKPDLGLVLNTNPAVLHLRDKSYKGIYDLCIEALSDSSKKDIVRDTVIKKAEYQAAGVSEYYILDSKNRETAFYRLGAQNQYVRILPAAGGIIRSSVLSGFQFRADDLHRCPSLEKMADDPVYQNFILPFYQEEKRRAEQAEQRADAEKQRAEAERQRADILAAKLRELGISV